MSEPKECAYCGREIREKASKVWVHVDDSCVYCDPFDPTNRGVAFPVARLRS